MSILLFVLSPDALSSEKKERLNSLAGDRQVVITQDKAVIEKSLDQVEIAAGHFSHEYIRKMPRLRWLQQWGAGADWLMENPELVERDFILTNASGVHAVPISEHIMAFLLAFARGLPASIRAQEKHEWAKDISKTVFELAGKTMLLVGVGAIGSRTAQIAAAMGMHVWGVRRHPDQPADGVERMVSPEQLPSLLPEADFVVLTVPETEETRHMINAQALSQMKPGAYLINIGRGATVDEQALVNALKQGQIAGAGLDVFEDEPLPQDSALWDLPNVILTAHYSGLTPRYNDRALAIFFDNLERYVRHQTLMNVVDKRLGY